MLVERKIITRPYYETMSNDETLKTGRFIVTGQWADGHLAYSRVDENDNIIEEDDGCYYQLRGENGLFMQHV